MSLPPNTIAQKRLTFDRLRYDRFVFVSVLLVLIISTALLQCLSDVVVQNGRTCKRIRNFK
jgi:hypothetical protein